MKFVPLSVSISSGITKWEKYLTNSPATLDASKDDRGTASGYHIA